MTSEIRVNKINNRSGLGTVTYSDTGIIVSGIVTANSFSGPFTGDLDVDGHTNLDNVSVAGVATFASNVGIAQSIFHDGDTDTTIGFPAANQIKIHTGGVERLLFTNSYNWLKNTTYVNTTILADTPTFLVRNDTQSYHTIWESQNTNARSTIFQWNDYGNSGTAGNLIFRSRNSPYEEHARFTGAGNFNLLKDLDVDGHTNLDNVSVAGISTFSNSLFLPDDQQVKLGNTAASPDFKIFHDSTANNNVIEGHLNSLNLRNYNVNCTDIVLSARRNIILQTNLNETGIQCLANGATEIFHDGGLTPKLRTSTTGIQVLGEVAASQDYPNFRPTTDFNFAKTKRLDPNIRYYRTGTASYTDEDGFIRVVGEGEPRFDHDPATKESLGLLIEESRTNLVNHSENLGYSTWSMNNAATRFKPTTEAPDGKTSDGGAMVDGNVQAGVWEIVETSSNSTHLVYQQLSGGNVSQSVNYHISAFAKPGLNRTHFVLTEGNTLSATAIFDVANGTVTHTFGTGSPQAKISGPYGDGWYRCVLRYTTTASQSYINIQLGVAQNGTTNSYAGDGSSSIAVWGVQIERSGTSETSYIQNWGRNNTRGREYIEVQNPNERFPLTIVSETSTKEFNYARRPFAMSPLGATDTIRPFINDSGDLVFFTSYNASSGYASHPQSETGLAVNVPFKYAYAISSTSVSSPDKSCVNGGTVKSSGNTTLSETKLTQYRIGYSTSGDAEREWMGHVRRFMIYDAFLSDGNLKTITSQ